MYKIKHNISLYSVAEFIRFFYILMNYLSRISMIGVMAMFF